MKIFIFWVIFFTGLVYTLERWSSNQLQQRASHFITVDELKKMYPFGIYPKPPTEIPEEKRYKGVQVFGEFRKHEHHFLNDPNLHKDSHRYIIRDASGKVLSDVDFYFDKFKRRFTPANDSKNKAKSFVAFLGDSNIFGYGLPQEETLSNYLSLKLQDFKVYNYAAPGMYPYEMMNLTETLDMDKEIPEKDGVVLYFFLSYHMHRNIGAFSELSQTYSFNKRVVDLDAKGEVVLKGTYKEEMPFRILIAPFIRKSATLAYFGVEFKPDDKDFRTETAIIKKMQKNIEGKGKKFYVVIHPFQPRIREAQALLPYLVKERIPFIYFGHWRMEKYTEGPTTLGFDMHVSKYFNQVFADGLSQVLKTELSVVK